MPEDIPYGGADLRTLPAGAYGHTSVYVNSYADIDFSEGDSRATLPYYGSLSFRTSTGVHVATLVFEDAASWNKLLTAVNALSAVKAPQTP